MTCYNKDPISIYQGFGTKWDNNDLLSVTFDSEISITGFGAEFIIGDVVKSYTNIQNGFSVNLTAQETGTLPLGPINGTLVLIDLENNKRPFSTQLPFLVKDWAGGDIKLDGFKITINANVQNSKLEIDIGTTNPLAINEETIRGYISVHNQDELAHTYIQDRITANTEKFADYRTSEAQDVIDATFEVASHAEDTYATKMELSNGLSSKQSTISDLDTIRANALAGKNASTTISEYGNIVTHSISEFATAAQGALAETALQSGDDITELVNNAGYITGIDSEDVSMALGYTPLSVTDVSRVALTGSYSDLSGTPTIGSGALTIQKNGSTVGSFSANATTNSTINITVPTNNTELLNGAGYITGISSSDVINALGFTPYNSTNPNNYQTATQVSNAIDTEASLREIGDNNLQSQIDAITSSSDVTDIVGTYYDLQHYNTTGLPNNSIIKVIKDESKDDETTYYRWVITAGVGGWILIGEEGPYYTKSEANNAFVPKTRTVNGKALSDNITLTAEDVGALPDSTVIPIANDATLTIQKNGSNIGTFTANASVDKTINITVPTQASDIGAVQANTEITGATKCKITYDSKGLVIAGSDLQISDIPSLTLSKISDVTASTSELNILDGVTASTAELNVLDGITATTTELNYVDGVTSAIQAQLNGKVPTSRTINNKQLNTDINLNASDVGALPSSTFIPTDTDELTNGAGFITISALNGYATETWVGQQGYLTVITSSNVTTALGYTPQQQLVSGTNIKTINGDSLLGSGNISTSDSTKANISLDNLDLTGKNIGNWSTNITNCITEIPQDIKLELNNSTITLKAGSKLYAPNGFEQDGVTLKFNTISIDSDISFTYSTAQTGSWFVIYEPTYNAIGLYAVETVTSGTTPPSSGLFYNTSDNSIKFYSSSIAYSIGIPFPLGVVSLQSTSPYIKSIDQVFNGFGYIGSTVFVLPGVKGLIPNGRNSDGTLKSNSFTVSNVIVSAAYTGDWRGKTYINATGLVYSNTTAYDANTNTLIDSDGFIGTSTHCCIGNHLVASGKVTLYPKQAFHALDYNDKGTIAGWGMPQKTGTSLTWGASGTQYTAPSNGWFAAYAAGATGSNVVVELQNISTPVGIMGGQYFWYNYGGAARIFCPAKTGDVVKLNYNGSFSTNILYFIPSVGEE